MQLKGKNVLQQNRCWNSHRMSLCMSSWIIEIIHSLLQQTNLYFGPTGICLKKPCYIFVNSHFLFLFFFAKNIRKSNSKQYKLATLLKTHRECWYQCLHFGSVLFKHGAYYAQQSWKWFPHSQYLKAYNRVFIIHTLMLTYKRRIVYLPFALLPL